MSSSQGSAKRESRPRLPGSTSTYVDPDVLREVLRSRGLLDGVVERLKRNGVPFRELVSRAHIPEIVIPRDEVCLLLYETGDFSYPGIGRLFGRDHTTIMAAVRRAKERRAKR